MSSPFLCKIRKTVVLFLLFVQVNLFAQTESGVTQFVQLNTILSDGENAPFWLTANRQGVSSLSSSNGYARYGININGNIGDEDKWRYTAGADIIAGYNQTSSLALHELYAGISWKWLNLTAGVKENFAETRTSSSSMFAECNSKGEVFSRLYGRTLAELGSGGLLYSGNSAPIPQLRLEVPDYVDIPGTGSWIKLRGHIAYGIFLDHNFQKDFTTSNPSAKYAKNVMYHSKALFMKLGNAEKFPLEVEGGLEMRAQFGGDFYTHAKGKYLSMPRGIKDYFKAFIPLSGDETTPTPEQANISGNQIGNWHLAFTLKTKPVDIRLYGEHLFEDFSQLFFFEYQTNREGKRKITYYPWKDIQIGVSVTNKTGYLKFISTVQYEYTSMYDQSGAGYNDPNDYFSEQMDGADDYYNHSIYPGWHNYGMGIGNPLAFSPLYNSNGTLVFRGNRFKAHNVGINGAFLKGEHLKYRLMYTYSENWGTYFIPFDEKKYTTSLLADIVYTPKNDWIFSFSLAYDKSNLIGDNWGAMFSVARIGLF